MIRMPYKQRKQSPSYAKILFPIVITVVTGIVSPRSGRAGRAF